MSPGDLIRWTRSPIDGMYPGGVTAWAIDVAGEWTEHEIPYDTPCVYLGPMRHATLDLVYVPGVGPIGTRWIDHAEVL